MRFKVGDRVRVTHGSDYVGLSGVIEYCKTCCRARRIQFDGIANNESFKNFKGKLEKYENI
jgi:hypothetical protein